MAWWWMAAALAAEAPEAPLRALWEIPLAPTRPGPFVDEEHLVDVVRLTLAADVPSIGEVEVSFEAEALWPRARGGGVVSPRFLGDGPGAHVQARALSDALYGGRLTWGGEAGDLHERIAVMATVELVHAMVHLAGDQAAPASDAWAAERRAVALEWVVLNRWVSEGRVPSTWLTAWDEANDAVVAALPAGVWSGLPRDDAGRRALFIDGQGAWSATLGGEPSTPLTVGQVAGLIAALRQEAMAGPPATSADLDALFLPPPPIPVSEALAALATEVGAAEGAQGTYVWQPEAYPGWWVELSEARGALVIAWVWRDRKVSARAMGPTLLAIAEDTPPSPWTVVGGRVQARAVLRDGAWADGGAQGALADLERAVARDAARVSAAVLR